MLTLSDDATKYKHTGHKKHFLKVRQQAVPFAKSIINKHYGNFLHHSDYDEIIDHCTSVTLLQALDKFDENKGTFSTYYYYKLRGFLSALTAKYVRQINTIYVEPATLSMLSNNPGNSLIRCNLEKNALHFYELLLIGYDIPKIIAKLKISKSRAIKMKKEIKHALKEL